jgi:hypothetical protein
MRLMGVGEVYDGEQLVATVRYDLQVERERLMVRPGHYVWALPTAEGSIQTLSGYVAFDELLTLVLEDDRRVQFYTTTTREGSGCDSVKVSGIPDS